MPDLPYDQRHEDGGSLVFDSDVLGEEMQILGAPVAELTLSADKPVAMVAVRLSALDAGGRATRVTYGLLNLTHRDSHEHPEPLEPGTPYRVRVPLNVIGQTFRAGQRLRLAVSSSYWPLAWPPPSNPTLTLHTAESRLLLPVRPPGPLPEDDAIFKPAETAQPLDTHIVQKPTMRWQINHNLVNLETTLEVLKDDGIVRLEDTGLRMGRSQHELYSFFESDYDTVHAATYTARSLRRGHWRVATKTHTVLTATPESFRIRADIDAWEGESRVFARSWDVRIPRDLV
jgi:hypothetical protein